jgi:ABC-type Fe3+-hydroxamate transport system substrate-binding protein
MTFNAGTYCHDVLARCGGRNVFADRDRRYPLEADLGEQAPEDPGGRDIRYPRVTVEEVRQLDPQCILLPQEPFAFNEADRDQIRNALEDTAAVRADRVHIVDGRLLTWHGTHLARSLAELPGLLQLP